MNSTCVCVCLIVEGAETCVMIISGNLLSEHLLVLFLLSIRLCLVGKVALLLINRITFVFQVLPMMTLEPFQENYFSEVRRSNKWHTTTGRKGLKLQIKGVLI